MKRLRARLLNNIVIFFICNKNKTDKDILRNFAKINEDVSLIYFDDKWNIVRKNIFTTEKKLSGILKLDNLVVHNEIKFIRQDNLNILYDAKK